MGRLRSTKSSPKWQAIFGILAALISIGVVLGGMLLAFAESGMGRAFNQPTALIVTPTSFPVLTSKPTQTQTGLIQTEPILTPTPTQTQTSVLEIACPPPSGWVVITVQAGDTLDDLAQTYQVTVQSLKDANCLLTNRLLPGVLIYVPAKPTEPPAATSNPTHTPIPCGPPANWYPYRVQAGDTLYSLAVATNTTVRELQVANCLPSPDRIRVGQIIYLPKPLPSITPTVTKTTIPAATTPPLLSADVRITLTAVPDPVDPGVNLDFTLTVNNAGPNAASSLVAKDTIPVGTNFVSASGTGWSCGFSSGVVTCTLASLSAGGSTAINIRVQVPAGASGSLANQASITSATSDPNLGNNAASQTISVTPRADLGLSMTVNTNSTTIGTPVNYSITIVNNGPSTATSLLLTDNVDVNSIGVAGISASGTGWNCTPGTTITCNLPSLASGSSSTVNISAQATAAGTLTNQASISSAVSDPNASNNNATRNTTITAQADLAVGISGPAGTVNINDTVNYTITITNNGPNTASTLQVQDIVDVNGIGITGLTAAGSGWSCTPGGTTTCTLPSLSSGSSSTITISVQPTGSGILRNSASVSSSVSDPNNSNNSAAIDITVN